MIKVLEELVLFEVCKRESLPCVSSSFWWFTDSLWHPCFVEASSWSLALSSYCSLPVCAQISPFYKETSCFGLGPTLPQYDLILTNNLFKDHISKLSHIMRYLGIQTSMYELLRHIYTVQPKIELQTYLSGF